MSSGNDKQQGGPPQGAGPIKVKELHFIDRNGVQVGGLRCMEGEGTIHVIVAGKHPRRSWTTEIVREPWHRMYRVTENDDAPEGKWAKVRTCLIPESAASYVPLEVG